MLKELDDLYLRAKQGDPNDVISFLYAYIQNVEQEALKKVPGPAGPPGATGPSGPPAPDFEIFGDQSVYAHRSSINGKIEVRIGLSGSRVTISDPLELPDNPTPAELIRHIQRLTMVIKELKRTLYDRQLIY